MRILLLLLLSVGFGCGSSAPRGGDGGTADLAGGGSGCQTAADCRLYSSYCSTDPCVCLALGRRDVDPPCLSGNQSCVIDPCSNKRAACVDGACAVQ
jgi:hypothetical protein